MEIGQIYYEDKKYKIVQYNELNIAVIDKPSKILGYYPDLFLALHGLIHKKIHRKFSENECHATLKSFMRRLEMLTQTITREVNNMIVDEPKKGQKSV